MPPVQHTLLSVGMNSKQQQDWENHGHCMKHLCLCQQRQLYALQRNAIWIPKDAWMGERAYHTCFLTHIVSVSRVWTSKAKADTRSASADFMNSAQFYSLGNVQDGNWGSSEPFLVTKLKEIPIQLASCNLPAKANLLLNLQWFHLAHSFNVTSGHFGMLVPNPLLIAIFWSGCSSVI